MTLDDCDSIFELALQSKSESEFRFLIEPLFNHYQILSLEIGRGTIFWRARQISEKPYLNLSELDYPPANLAKTGRLNDINEPCFYISAREETALAEVEAQDGQLIQLAGFRILNEAPIRLAVIGEFSNVQKNGYMRFPGQDPDMVIANILNGMPHQAALTKLYIDRFFAHVLSDPNASKNGYLFCRALRHSIYSINPSSGIVFPSVKDSGGFNLAIKAEASDQSFQNVACVVVKINKIRKFGMIEFDIVQSALHLDDNNNFIWKDQSNPYEIGIYGLTKDEYEAALIATPNSNTLLNITRSNNYRKS